MTHSKFLAFIGEPSSDGMLSAEFCENAQRKADECGAAKSIGIEYLEKQNKVILTIGYDPTLHWTSPVKIQLINLGKLELNADAISAAMEKAADSVNGVICHEFYVSESGNFIEEFNNSIPIMVADIIRHRTTLKNPVAQKHLENIVSDWNLEPSDTNSDTPSDTTIKERLEKMEKSIENIWRAIQDIPRPGK